MSDRSSSPTFDEVSCSQDQILQDLFDGPLDAETAAPKLAAITIPDPNIDEEECQGNLMCLWSNTLSYLWQDSARLQIVADLIYRISQLPAPLTDSGKQLTLNEGLLRVWEDTPALGWEFRDEWNVYVPAEDPARQTKIKRFIAANALVATLIMLDEQRFDYHSFAIYTLRDALEYSYPAASEDDISWPDCAVPAAAKLIEIAGRKICGWDLEFESGPLIGDRGRGGPLWNGKHGFCKERWGLWRRRFSELSRDVQLGSEVRESARKAGEIMEDIDG